MPTDPEAARGRRGRHASRFAGSVRAEGYGLARHELERCGQQLADCEHHDGGPTLAVQRWGPSSRRWGWSHRCYCTESCPSGPRAFVFPPRDGRTAGPTYCVLPPGNSRRTPVAEGVQRSTLSRLTRANVIPGPLTGPARHGCPRTCRVGCREPTRVICHAAEVKRPERIGAASRYSNRGPARLARGGRRTAGPRVTYAAIQHPEVAYATGSPADHRQAQRGRSVTAAKGRPRRGGAGAVVKC